MGPDSGTYLCDSRACGEDCKPYYAAYADLCGIGVPTWGALHSVGIMEICMATMEDYHGRAWHGTRAATTKRECHIGGGKSTSYNPTRTFSSPWPKSSMRRTRAQRAGSRRVSKHRRTSTMRFNPSMPGECGFESVLYISGIRSGKDTVGALRTVVADIVYKAYPGWRNSRRL